MDFELSSEQRLLVDNVDNFVKRDSPLSRFRQQRGEDPGWSKEQWAQMGELGWLALPFPESTGGLGMGFLEVALILERLGTTLVPEPLISSVVVCGTALAKAGSAAQQEEHLGPMMEGKTTLALCYAEEKSRHNVSCVSTQAKSEGGGFALSGKKRWALHADAADQLLVSARTGGEVSDPEGVSLFLVDPKAPGVTIEKLTTIDGGRAAHVSLDSVKIGAEALVGDKDGAAALLTELMDRAAAAACAEGAGLLESAFEMTKEYLCDREQFGAKIGSFQALQHRAVDMFIELQLAKATMLLAALKVDESPATRARAVSTAKVQLTESGNFITRQAIQLHGGIGVTDEHDVGLFYKRMIALNSLGGDSAFHLRRFGEAM